MTDLEKAMVNAAADQLHRDMKGRKYSAWVDHIDAKSRTIYMTVCDAAVPLTITVGTADDMPTEGVTVIDATSTAPVTLKRR